MGCQRCQSLRIAGVCAKCSDCCSVQMGNEDHQGYVPGDMGIGGDDYVDFEWCLDCGQMQGKFPLPASEIEKDISDTDVLEFVENSALLAEGRVIADIPPLNRLKLIDSATDFDPKFGKFMQEFLAQHNDIYSRAKMCSAQKFLEMYREKNYDLP